MDSIVYGYVGIICVVTDWWFAASEKLRLVQTQENSRQSYCQPSHRVSNYYPDDTRQTP